MNIELLKESLNLLNDFPEYILYQFSSRVSNYLQTLPKGYRVDCSRKRLCLHKRQTKRISYSYK